MSRPPTTDVDRTLLVAAALSAVAGAWLALPAGPVPRPWALAVAAGALTTGFVGAVVARGHRSRLVAAAALSLAAGLAVAALSGAPAENQRWAELVRTRAIVEVDVVLTGDPVLRGRAAPGGRYGPDQVAVAVRVEVVRWPQQSALRGRLPVDVLGPSHGWAARLPGDRVRLRGRLSAGEPGRALLRAETTPELLRRTGHLGRAAGHVRQRFRRAVDGLPDDQRGLVPGLVLGDVSRLPETTRDDFRASGLTHLYAVSGANLAIAVGGLLALAALIGTSPGARVAIGLVGTSAYVVLARPSPSVLRAAVMASLALLATATHRERDGVRLLALATLVLVLVSPGLAREPGFALSACATGGLLVLAPPLRQWLEGRVPPRLAEALALPLAAQLACLPLLVALSGRISLIALPANVIAAPAVAPATLVGALTAVFATVSLPLARAMAWVAAWPARWLLAVAAWGADAPLTAIPWRPGWSGALAAVAALAVLRRVARSLVLRRLALVGAVTLLLAPVLLRPVGLGWPAPAWAAVVCDVGQGDAVVLRGTDAALLVDVGPDPRAVDACLDRLGVRRLAAVVVTHLHADHLGGLVGVTRRRAVGELVRGPSEEPAGGLALLTESSRRAWAPIRVASAGESWSLPPWRLTVLAPASAYVGTTSDPNNSSLVLLAERPGLRLLLTGDVEEPAQADLLALGADLRADVVKVAHHGSAHQLPAFLAATRSSFALVSAGADNDYGHPARSTTEALERAGARVVRTDTEGDIALVVDGGRLGVLTRGRRGSSARR